ncbi:hypothetical protein U6A24_21405 [Aquimarina gracilis]|uniref:Uncharacterized protein n=1 Tax=Aquimarina gracilis TaxID=874422 RepID=A0ABU6A1S4_9FLAO|nr:hypothetical protein [Aquimarina gracilis]MEB3348047.1 hypothetical protein [Aquimarina gracilis]
MAKFYFKSSQKEEKHLVPSRRTVDFLLNYSKSLKVTEYGNLKFETILN